MKLAGIVPATFALSLGWCAAAELPKCHEEATALPDGWQRVLAPAKDVSFALPRGFARSEQQPEFMHGGELWSGPGVEVTIAYGMWRMSSFDLKGADHVCQARISDIPVVLIAMSGKEQQSMIAWIQTKGEPYEPVLSISFGAPDDLAVARHIVGSLQRGMSP